MPKGLIETLSLAAAGLILAGASVQADELPALVIDKSQVSVSGLSSGAYMAGQMHVAYSGTFTRGAGIIAGGPFYCAEGRFNQAVNRCIAGKDSPASRRYIDPKAVADHLAVRTRNYVLKGDIDQTQNLAMGKVWLFTGGRSDFGIHDTTVNWRLTDALKEYYLKYLPEGNIFYKNDLRAEHAMPTDSFGNACSVKGDPYINQCGFDTAGAILNWLHGPLNPRNNGDLSGTLVAFDQSPYLAAPTTHGMNGTGWVYVPAACAQGRTCKLHVAFHGCKQHPTYIYHTGSGAQTYGETYVGNAGYNRWADSNDMVVLYPQGHDSPRNPSGCWDWWGYDDANYATRKGRQMAAVKGMVDRLAGGTPAVDLPPPADIAVAAVTGDSVTLSWSPVNGAAGTAVYRGGARVATPGSGDGRYTDGGLAAGTTYSYSLRSADGTGAEGPPSQAVTVKTKGVAVACYTANNFDHVLSGRAYQVWGWTLAKGSNQDMGLFSLAVTTTLKKLKPSYYEVGACP